MRDTDIRARLEQESSEYQGLMAQHADFEQRLSELQRKPWLSSQELVERTNLKKYKLRVKDQMEALVRRDRGLPT